MEIRAAAFDDLPRVEQLVERVGLPIDGLSDQFPRGYVLATRDGELLGCAGLEVYERVGLLRSVAVFDDSRGRGIGRALVKERLRAADAAQLDAVYLLTTTAGDYFVRLGFASADRTSVPAALSMSPEFARACPASARCLVLALGGRWQSPDCL